MQEKKRKVSAFCVFIFYLNVRVFLFPHLLQMSAGILRKKTPNFYLLLKFETNFCKVFVKREKT